MPWVKVDDHFYCNPKVLQVGMPARGLWITLLTFAGNNLTDGFIDKKIVRQLGGTAAQLRQLLAVGILEEIEGGYVIHDYLTYNPARADVEARRESNRRRQKVVRGGESGGKNEAEKVVDNVVDNFGGDGKNVVLDQNEISIRSAIDPNENTTRSQIDPNENSGFSPDLQKRENVASNKPRALQATISPPYPNPNLEVLKVEGELEVLGAQESPPPFQPPQPDWLTRLGPPGCPDHAHLASWERPRCGRCAELRKAYEADQDRREAARQAAERAARQAARDAIAACPLCDPHGWREGSGGVVRCNHKP